MMSAKKTPVKGKFTYSLEELMNKDDNRIGSTSSSPSLPNNLKSPGTPGRTRKKISAQPQLKKRPSSKGLQRQDEGGYNSDGVMSKKKTELRSKMQAEKELAKLQQQQTPPPPPPSSSPPSGTPSTPRSRKTTPRQTPPTPGTATPSTPRSRKTPSKLKPIRRSSGGALIGGSKTAIDDDDYDAEAGGYSSDGVISKRKGAIRAKFQAEKAVSKTHQTTPPSRTSSEDSTTQPPKKSPGANSSRKRSVLRKTTSNDSKDDSIDGMLKSPACTKKRSLRKVPSSSDDDDNDRILKSPGSIIKSPKIVTAMRKLKKTASDSANDESALTVKSMPAGRFSDSPSQLKKQVSSLFKRTPSNKSLDRLSDHQQHPDNHKNNNNGGTPSRSRPTASLKKVPSNKRIDRGRSASPGPTGGDTGPRGISRTGMKRIDRGRSTSPGGRPGGMNGLINSPRSGMKRRPSGNHLDGSSHHSRRSTTSRDGGQPSNNNRSLRGGRRIADYLKQSNHSTGGTISISTSEELSLSGDEMEGGGKSVSRPKYVRSQSTGSRSFIDPDDPQSQKRIRKLVDENIDLKRENKKLSQKVEELEDRLNDERLNNFSLKKSNHGDDDNNVKNVNAKHPSSSDKDSGSSVNELRLKVEELEEQNKRLAVIANDRGGLDGEMTLDDIDKMSRSELIVSLSKSKIMLSAKESTLSTQKKEIDRLQQEKRDQNGDVASQSSTTRTQRQGEIEAELRSRDDMIQLLMTELEKLKSKSGKATNGTKPLGRFGLRK